MYVSINPIVLVLTLYLVWPMIVAGVCELTGSNINFSNTEFCWFDGCC